MILEERSKTALTLRNAPAVTVHQRQLQGDQGGELARFHHAEIDPAQHVERLRTRELRAHDVRNPCVDAEVLDEIASVSRLFEPDEPAWIAWRRPSQQHGFFAVGEGDV